MVIVGNEAAVSVHRAAYRSNLDNNTETTQSSLLEILEQALKGLLDINADSSGRLLKTGLVTGSAQLSVDGFLLVTQALARTYGGDIDVVERQFVCRAAETTVVVRSDNPDSEVRFYADIGLPSPADQLRIYRAALEENLIRRTETVSIGVHVESDRMVATAALTHREMGDVEALEATARKVMEQLFVCVHGMRARFAFFSE